jgi:hypothetical protein
MQPLNSATIGTATAKRITLFIAFIHTPMELAEQDGCGTLKYRFPVADKNSLSYWLIRP